MAEKKELTKIEREIVLQYLVDDNVPLTVTLEEKPVQSDAEITDRKIEPDERIPPGAVFPVAIPSKQITVLNQGIILLKNPARTVKPFLGKRVKVQFYFNHLGLYFVTTMKECSQGLAVVVPSEILRIPDHAEKKECTFSAEISYGVENSVVKIQCVPLENYGIFSQPKWSEIPEENQREAKSLLEKFVQETKENGANSGNGLHLIPVVRFLTEKNQEEPQSVECRTKTPGIIFADERRIVVAAENCGMEEGAEFSVSLNFVLKNPGLPPRSVKAKCTAEKIFAARKKECVSLKYVCANEEDYRFLYERITGKILNS